MIKPIDAAIDKAQLKSEIQDQFDFCIEQNVCPKCANDLKRIVGNDVTSNTVAMCVSNQCSFKHSII